MASDIRKQIEDLRVQIREHDWRYYVDHQPVVSDQQYDELFSQLKKLESENPEYITADSPTQRVSESPSEGFANVHHTAAMLSMDNTYNADELRKFDERVAKQLGTIDYDYVVEWLIEERDNPRQLSEIYTQADLNRPEVVLQVVKWALDAYEGGAR